MTLGSLSSLFALNYSSLKNKQTVLPERIFKQCCLCSYKKCVTVLITEAMTCNIVPAFNRM